MTLVTEGNEVVRHRYQIIVAGGLGRIGRQAFENLRVESHGTNTALIGELDQAALYDTLHRVEALGLQLIELTRLASDGSRPG